MPHPDPLREALNGVVTKSTWRSDNTVLIHDGTAWNTLVGRIVMATNGERDTEAEATIAAFRAALDGLVKAGEAVMESDALDPDEFLDLDRALRAALATAKEATDA
jgi:hypothetical protein